MNKTISSGAIVKNNKFILLVKETGEFWSFPKGHAEKGESLIDTAKREIVEETGLKKFEYVKKLGVYERNQRNDDGTINKNILKEIHIYLFKTDCLNLLLGKKEIFDAKWISLEKVTDLLTINEDKTFFNKVRKGLR